MNLMYLDPFFAYFNTDFYIFFKIIINQFIILKLVIKEKI